LSQETSDQVVKHIRSIVKNEKTDADKKYIFDGWDLICLKVSFEIRTTVCGKCLIVTNDNSTVYIHQNFVVINRDDDKIFLSSSGRIDLNGKPIGCWGKDK
jgi:hypothetical protein